jgi:hypothetical protein
MSCASGCPRPGSHETWGECVRSKGVAVMGLESTGNDYTKARFVSRENAAYRAAVAEGLQPNAPSHLEIDKVRRRADALGSVPA